MKSATIKITFLGTGANGGVPQVDCRCRFCSNPDTSEKRLRSSILIESSRDKVILDCGPDFRQQLLYRKMRLQDVSVIVLTHLHWDHSVGLVELSSGKSLKVKILAPAPLKKALLTHQLFGFLFRNSFAEFAKNLKNIQVKFIEVPHDPLFPTFGQIIRIGQKTILVTTDVIRITSALARAAKEADLVVFDGTFLNKSRHWHLAIKRSAPVLRKLNKRVVFTHVNHSEDPEKIRKFLRPFGFELAFDGVVLKV